MSITSAVVIVEKGLTFDIVRQSGLFPPFQTLNSFFQCGVDDAASEITLQWEPFSLNLAEYEELHESCQKSFGKLTIDGLGCDGYSNWFSAVVERRPNG